MIEQQHDDELQQVYDRRRAYLTDFRMYNESAARMFESCYEAETEFAKIAIRFCYILNAGGLIAVPAIVEILSPEKVSVLLWPAVLFAVGVLLSTTTNYCAYRSTNLAVEAWTHESTARAKETFQAYYPREKATQGNEIENERGSYKRKLSSSRSWVTIAVVAFVLAIMAFLSGVGVAILRISTTPRAAVTTIDRMDQKLDLLLESKEITSKARR